MRHILYPALRQYRHNNSGDLVHAFDLDETKKIVSGLQAEIDRLAGDLNIMRLQRNAARNQKTTTQR